MMSRWILLVKRRDFPVLEKSIKIMGWKQVEAFDSFRDDLILTIILFLSLANLGLVQISPGIFNMIEYGAVGDGITEDSKVLLLRHGKQHAGTTLEFAPS
ncbi:hypothetical protein ACOSQ2_021161 [Xanthoceras sorbifolium]